MLLDDIVQNLPAELLRHIASFHFRPTYRCDLCQEIFGHTSKYRYYSAATNLKGTRRAQPVPVLYLSWDSAFSIHYVMGNGLYCNRCITACGFQNFIDPILELAFFTRQQVVVIQDFQSAFHDYHVMLLDWPKEDKPFTSAEQVIATMRLRKDGMFRGFCMYTVRLNAALVCDLAKKHTQHVMKTLFEKGHMHFYGNESARFSDIFMNFRLMEGKQKSFSFWVEAELVEALQIQSFPSSQQQIVSHFYMSSDNVEAWTLERIRIALPNFDVDALHHYRIEMNGDLYHIPTQTLMTPVSIYIVPPPGDDLFVFMRSVQFAHPNDDHVPYHFNSDLYSITDSETESDSDSIATVVRRPWPDGPIDEIEIE